MLRFEVPLPRNWHKRVFSWFETGFTNLLFFSHFVGIFEFIGCIFQRYDPKRVFVCFEIGFTALGVLFLALLIFFPYIGGTVAKIWAKKCTYRI